MGVGGVASDELYRYLCVAVPRKAIAVKLIAFLFLTASWLTEGMAHAAAASRLPEPTGPYGIGRIAYDWTDNLRSDSLGPDPTPLLP